MNIYDLPAHPSAEIFPMMHEDELNELAEDIAANGLNHPIVIGLYESNPVLIDGRNRRAACQIAGIETPDYVELEGKDVEAFILSENVNRRHLNKGQRAMAAAMLYPKSEQGTRNGTSIKNIEVSRQYVTHARTVLKQTPGAAQQVLDGITPLNDAYKVALEMKRNQEGDAEKYRKLRESSPDLADLVDDGGLSVDEATATLFKRQTEAREVEINRRRTLYGILHEAIQKMELAADAVKEIRELDNWAGLLTDYYPGGEDRLAGSAGSVKRAHEAISEIVKEAKENGQ